MQRLRYNKTEDGKFINKTPLIAGGDLVTVEVWGLKFKIKSSSGNTLIEGDTKNNFDLKKNIKSNLKSLGVSFLDEVRSKKLKEEN